MSLYKDIKELRDKSISERESREDDRWVSPYYIGLQDLKVGQHVWVVGTVGMGCDNRIWEEIITGEMKTDDTWGYLLFKTKGINSCGCWYRLNNIGHSIFFTKEEAELMFVERIKKYNSRR